MISGTVYADNDFNGVKSAPDKPAAGWTVYLDLDNSGTLNTDAAGTLEPSAVTDSNGDFSIGHLIPGTYRISEVLQAGWSPTAPVSQDVVVENRRDTRVSFFDFAGGKIEGTVWDDLDGDGERAQDPTTLEFTEPGLAGWTVYLDLNSDLAPNAGEPVTVTDADGRYVFSNLPEDNYHVTEVLPDGWEPTRHNDVDKTVSVTPLSEMIQDFGNVSVVNGSIQGIAWNDTNFNGIRGVDPVTGAFTEPGLEGWTLFLDDNLDGILNPGEQTAVTNADGYYVFPSVAAGHHEVTQVLPADWHVAPGFSLSEEVDVNAGTLVTAPEFANFTILNGSIRGTVWNDRFRDGVRDTSLTGAYLDPGLVGWQIFLDLNRNGVNDAGEPVAVTDGNGNYAFDDLQVGDYRVQEILPAGWETTEGFADHQTVTVFSGSESVAPDFANFDLSVIIPGTLTGTVWNDLDGNGIRNITPSTGVFTDPALPGRVVFVDGNGNGVLDTGELSATSATDGTYSISGVTPGTVTLVEAVPAGWRATAPVGASRTFSLRNAQTLGGLDFGNFAIQESTIQGTVFADTNRNGSRDAGERGLAGMTVFLDTNDNGALDAGEQSQTTSADLFYTPTIDEAGAYSFTHLATGTYHVRMILTSALSATPAAQLAHTVTLDVAQIVTGVNTAAVYRANEIHGSKFADLNGNHTWDVGEHGISGSTVYLDLDRDDVHDADEPTTVTGEDGSYAFTGLTPGAYVVREIEDEGYETSYPTTTGGTLWPAGVSNPASGNVTPGAITVALANGQSHHETVTLTLPGSGSLTNLVDVFLLFDDTGSFTYNSPIVRSAFPTIISQLQSALPGIDLGFGVGRFEEYGNFAFEYSTGRPFILNQPIVAASTPGYLTAIQAALNRTTPGYGGDGPETDIEALYQLVTGAGFDGNNNGSVLDSGAAGLAATQLNPGNSGDVPSFASFQADTANSVLPAAGNVGGGGFRAGALPIILTATDIGFAYQPKGETSISGVGGVTLPVSALTGTSRPTTPFSAGAGLQETVTALNALGALVIGLGTNPQATVDPRQGLEALSKLTGAVNRSTTTIANGTTDPIAPGDPLYFQISSGFAGSVTDGIVNAIQNAATTVAYDITLQASDPRVRIINHSGTQSGIGAAQTATFDVEFVGDGVPHRFDLQFVRAGTNVVLGSIPVVLGTPVPGNGYEFEDLEEGEIHHSVDFGSHLVSSAAPSITLEAGTVVYDGHPHAVTATAVDSSGNPVAGTFAFTYNGQSTAPTHAGTYDVVATFTSSDPGFANTTRTGQLTIAAATPALEVTGGTIAYDAAAHSASAIATGVSGEAVSGLVTFTYNGSATVPTAAGVYDVVATFASTNPDYANATGSATLTITPATPTLTVTGGSFTADGSSHAATATATGIGGATISGTFAFTYNGSTTIPTVAGVYAVAATFTSSDANYTDATGTATLTIVSSGPTAPSGINLSGGSLTQTRWSNSVAGVLSAVDANSGDTFRYTLVTGTGATDNSKFSISGTLLRFRTAVTAPAGTNYSIRVRVTDQTGLFFDKVLTVTVAAGDLSTVDVAYNGGSLTQSAWANSPAGSLASTHAGTRYSLVGGAGSTNNALFRVTGGNLTAKAAVTAAAGTIYSVRVRATDADGLFLDTVATITVTAGDTTVPAAPLVGASLPENAGALALAGTLPAEITGGTGPFTVALVSGTGATDNAKFRVSGAQILAANSLNYELKSLYSIRLRITDASGRYFDQVQTIAVTDVNEAPTALSISTTSVSSTSAIGALLATLTGLDPDHGDSLVYALVAGGTNNSLFTITGNELRLAQPLTAGKVYTIRVRVTDSHGLFFDKTFRLTATA